MDRKELFFFLHLLETAFTAQALPISPDSNKILFSSICSGDGKFEKRLACMAGLTLILAPRGANHFP
jgi:hypothetical protein